MLAAAGRTVKADRAVQHDQIEDIYRLSPVQEGMLFHALHAEEPGVYLQQFVFTIGGELDAGAFARAFQEAVDRHPALRTAFVWEREGRPLQVVTRRAVLEVRQEEWAAAPSAATRQRLADLLERDQRRGCDLARPPLLRLTLARAGGEQYMLWTYHHLVLDGWSMALVLGEVIARHAALVGGVPFALAAPRPFRDYVAWLERQDLGAAEAYWRRTLAGAEKAMLPAAEAPGRRAAGEPVAGRLTQSLPAALRRRLEERAQRGGLTLNTLAQGAWALLLGSLCDLDDVVYGTVVSGRPAELEGVESMVGMFINTLPARVRIAADRPLAAWLRELQTAQMEMRRFEYSPLPQVHAWSGAAPAEPLFETILVFENRALFSTGGAAGGLRLRGIDHQGATSYPLAAAVEPGDELALTLAHDGRRFDAVTVSRWLGHFATLLASLAGGLDRPVGSLSPLAAGERHQVLCEWNDTHVEMGEQCLHRLFAAQAARAPGAAALVGAEEDLSYGELDRRANRLAHHLRRLGVGPEVPVGILLRRSSERIMAVLAVLKAGGAYLPLDPEQPAPRLAAMIADSGAPLVVSRRALALEPAAARGPRLVLLDEEAAVIAGRPEGEPASGVEPRHLAYVIYTSGSSGQPKGVMVPHREIGWTLAWRQVVYPLGAGDRVLQTNSFGADASLWSIFAPLLAGASLVLALPEGAAGSDEVGAAVQRHRITALQLPPAWLRHFLEQEASAPGLRYVICGGEALTADLQERLAAVCGAELHNLYGPPDAALDATFWPCRGGERRAALPIGRPIGGKRIYVLDRLGSAVPIGAAGELCIGGAGLARGYRGDARLTAARFVPDPWSAAPGGRLYRSGDLAHWLPDGNLEFLGRADHQIKVRGFRVEPGEIEVALCRHPAVRHAVVVARQEPGAAARRLVAYFSRRGETSPSTSELRRFLEELLPDSMVPAAFVEMEALPLNATGKVDRARLPVPGAERPLLERPFAAPRDDRETLLAAVWSAVLGVERVGVDDNFFDLGGDSILSLQIVARARKAGLQITTRQLFEHQTVAELAAACGGGGGVGGVGSEAGGGGDRSGAGEAGTAAGIEIRAEQAEVTGEASLLPIQQWFFDAVRTARQHWNQAVLLKPLRRLELAPLAAALGALGRHHDALRLRFVGGDGGTGEVRQIHAAAGSGEAPLASVDLAALPAARRPAAMERAAAALQGSLRLAAGPLLRAACFELGAGEPQRLLVIVHHLVVDGVSWQPLLEDLGVAYGQLARGEAPRLPAKTSSFKAWAERLRQHAGSPAVAAELETWLAVVPAELAPLPRDRQDGGNREAMRRTVRVELPAAATRALLRRQRPGSPGGPGAQGGAAIEAALLGALALAFRSWTGQPGLLVDLEGHGREDLFDDLGLWRTVGWFTTEYPVRLRLDAGDGPAAALQRVREVLGRVPAKGIGYGLLRYLHPDAAVRERLRALPRAEVVFNYLGQLDAAPAEAALWEVAAEPAGPPRSPRGERPYLFDLNGGVSGGALYFDWGYSAEIHDRATVERLAGAFLDALRQLAALGELGALAPLATLPAPPDRVAGAGYMPSDFPLARLDQATLDRIAPPGRLVEDLYPLSPMQQGLLFDSLYAGGGVYLLQLACTLRGDLDPAAFAEAWRQLVQRHSVLRTAFVWEQCDQPLQMVLREVPPAVATEDWRGVAAAEQERRLEELAAAERQSFDLTRPPLMHLHLVRLSDLSWRFLWTSHHLVLDGWSTPMLFAELFALYRARRQGVAARLPARRPYRDYIAWLVARGLADAERYFGAALRGYRGALPPEALLLPGELRRPGAAQEEVRALVAAERTAAIQALARRLRVTLSTVVQAAWALVLGQTQGDLDVVLGITLAGRPAALDGVETMIGMFINTLPLRLQPAPERPLAAWLREHQARLAELVENQYAPLAKIQHWCPTAAGRTLFASIVVFENYPEPAAPAAGPGGEDGRDELAVGDVTYAIREAFPLILDVGPGAELSLRLRFDAGLYRRDALADAVDDLDALLAHFAAAPDEALAGCLAMLEQRAAARHEARRETQRIEGRQRLQQVMRRRSPEPAGSGS